MPEMDKYPSGKAKTKHFGKRPLATIWAYLSLDEAGGRIFADCVLTQLPVVNR
jgi:hypothetical protein